MCVGKMTRRGHFATARKKTINQESGDNGDVDGSVVSVTVPSVSVTWIKNGSGCDTTERCFSAHQEKACFHPVLNYLFFQRYLKIDSATNNMKTTLMRRAIEKHVMCLNVSVLLHNRSNTRNASKIVSTILFPPFTKLACN